MRVIQQKRKLGWPAVALGAMLMFLTASAARAGKRPGWTSYRVTVIATLLDSPARAYPLCGVFHVFAEFRYHVLKVVKGRLRPRVIIARHSCPDARNFVKGARYRLSLNVIGPPSRKPGLTAFRHPSKSLPRFKAVGFKRLAVLPKWKWDARAVRFSWYRSLARSRSGKYRVEPAGKPGTFGRFPIRVRRGRKTLHTWKGHTESAFVFVKPHVIVVSHHSRIATGVTLEAHDLAKKKRLWRTNLKGCGPVSHSKYRNRINLAAGPLATVTVFGWESHCRYIEAVDIHTGKTIGHRKLP